MCILLIAHRYDCVIVYLFILLRFSIILHIIEYILVYITLITGKGLTLVASVLEGQYADRFADAQAAQQVNTSNY